MIVLALDEPLLLEVVQMLVHGGKRRQPEVLADFGQRRRIAVFADIIVQVVD